MSNIFKVVKYQVHDFIMAMIIFYAIVLAICTLIISSIMGLETQTAENITVGGLGGAAVIFLFVSGLNCFKVNFKFLQANNVSRKRFFYANVISLFVVSLFMAAVDVILSNVMKRAVPYQGLFEQLYKKDFFLADFTWNFGLYIFAASLGWLITMLYYKCGKFMKTVISIAPILFLILLSVINSRVNGALGRAVTEFFGAVLGFSYNYNSYMAVLSFLVGAAAISALSYLLIRRAPVKD